MFVFEGGFVLHCFWVDLCFPCLFSRNFYPKSSFQPSENNIQRMILLMEEILHLLIGSLSHYLQGFIHSRWLFGISAINIRSGESKRRAYKMENHDFTMFHPFQMEHIFLNRPRPYTPVNYNVAIQNFPRTLTWQKLGFPGCYVS